MTDPTPTSGAGLRHPTSDEATLRRWLTAGVGATAVIVLSLPVYLVKERTTGVVVG